jgi:hypothetical protein
LRKGHLNAFNDIGLARVSIIRLSIAARFAFFLQHGAYAVLKDKSLETISQPNYQHRKAKRGHSMIEVLVASINVDGTT